MPYKNSTDRNTTGRKWNAKERVRKNLASECYFLGCHSPRTEGKKSCSFHAEQVRLRATRRDKEQKNRWERERLLRLKTTVLTQYGPDHQLGCCWRYCHEKDVDVLSLDHVNNDGAKERKQLGKRGMGSGLYSRLRRQGYPQGYQTLCMNHQMKKQLMTIRGDYVPCIPSTSIS